MKAGRLTRVIEVQRRTDGVNDYGTPSPVWSRHMVLRAELVERTTSEFLTTAGATDAAVVVFRTRHVAGLTTADRVAFDGVTYNVRELAEIGRRRGLEFHCEAMPGGTS